MACAACWEPDASIIVAGYSLCSTHATEITAAIVVGRSASQWFREAAVENYAERGLL